jgi:hypothetical protein
MDAGMSAAAPVLQGFDPGPEIRRSVRGHERHRPRLRRATRELARFAGLDERASTRALEPRLATLRAALWYKSAELSRSYFGRGGLSGIHLIIYGAILIAVVLFFPRGAYPYLGGLLRRKRRAS